jgi:hypothetical protein
MVGVAQETLDGDSDSAAPEFGEEVVVDVPAAGAALLEEPLG